MPWYQLDDANDPKLDELPRQYNLHPLHIEDARSADESVKVDTAPTTPGCPFVCHFAAERRNLLLPCFLLADKGNVISTEAVQSFIVNSAVERSAFLQRTLLSTCHSYQSTPRTGFFASGRTVSPSNCRRFTSIVVVIAVSGTS